MVSLNRHYKHSWLHYTPQAKIQVMTALSSGYMSKCCALTWERKKIAMYEQIVTVRLHTHKKGWLHHCWHLQSAKNSLQKSVWSFCALSKILQSHFVRLHSQESPARSRTRDPLLTKWLALSRIILMSVYMNSLSVLWWLQLVASNLRGNPSITNARSWFYVAIQAAWLEVELCQFCSKSQNRVLIGGAADYKAS